MNLKEIAKEYLIHLEKGNINQVIELFDASGIVESPLYGIKPANEFYHELNDDTSNSELILRGIFKEDDSNQLALYFTYKWTLKNDEKVEFDVVDIIEFNSKNKIERLKIIYDTVVARKLIEELKN